MKHLPFSHPYHARRTGSALGKAISTIASLLTIAAILFVGTRNWKSGNPVTALLDVSDIRSLFSQTGDSKSAENAEPEKAQNSNAGSLIEKGTLVRRSSQLTAANIPAGLSRDLARH